jgi:hypothetical protein
MRSRPYENNLKLLLTTEMTHSDLTLDEAMTAYAWFDHYYPRVGGQKAYALVSRYVHQQREKLRQQPPTPAPTEWFRRWLGR